MKKILITTSSFDLMHFQQVEQSLSLAGFDIILNPYKRRLTADEVKILLTDNVVGIIAGVEPLTQTVLESAPNLKVIARCGTGLDNVDLVTATKLGIRVSNTPDAPTLAVAELTIAHMLNLLRSVSCAHHSMRKGDWIPCMGSLLKDKNVGVIGFGRIGRKVAELVSAFGARVLAYDSMMQANIDTQLAKAAELNDLLRESDMITLHVPVNADSYHMIGQAEIRQMKSSAFLFNLSRGGLVDETALYHALREKRLAGAGLDTFETEPYSGPLSAMENVLMTPHMGSYAQEARSMQEKASVANLIADLQALNLLVC